MKRIFWIILIFTLLFSLTGLFAQQEVSVTKSTDESEVTIEKSGNKVSEMKKVYVRYNDKRNNIIPEKTTRKIVDVNSDRNQLQTRTSVKATKASQTIEASKKATQGKKVYRNSYIKKKNMVNSKKIKSVTVEAVSSD